MRISTALGLGLAAALMAGRVLAGDLEDFMALFSTQEWGVHPMS